MREVTVFVPPQDDGKDVRTFVRRSLQLSARVFTALKHEGVMLCNGAPITAVDRLHAGDCLQFSLHETPERYEGVNLPFSVLYEDADYLIVDKPQNMPVYPTPGHDRDSLLNAVAFQMREDDRFTFRPLYRLDRDTGGVLVIAKNKFAALSTVIKEYYAIVEGCLEGEGTICLPIGLAPGHRVQRQAGCGQAAITNYRAMGSDGVHTLVACRLETGRTHQIRVHMAAIGHPLAGDDLYGGHLNWVQRQALICKSAEVCCPLLRFQRTFSAEFPAELQKAFATLL